MTQLTNNIASVTTEITDGSLSFGVELKNYQSNDCKFDHFTLEYLGGGETPSAITPVSRPNSVGQLIYDLSGRRLNRLQKGINIVNGKKRVY